MSDLASIQRTIAEAIRGDGPAAEGVERYRAQFFLRHVAVLEEDFVSIVHALGHDELHALARRYLSAHPPTSFTLRDLGHAFASFLEDPFLRELARVEWAFVEVFDGPDAPPLDPTTLAGVAEDAWPHARIVLQPSMRHLVLDYPAHEYRHAVRAGEEPARPVARRCHVVVSRGPETLRHTELEPLAFALLEEIVKGATLEEACDRVAPPRDAVAEWFRRWTESGWISAIYFPPPLPV